MKKSGIFILLGIGTLKMIGASTQEIPAKLSEPIDSLGSEPQRGSQTLHELVVEGATVVTSDGKMLYTPKVFTTEASTYAIDLLGRLGIPALRYNSFDRTFTSALGTPVILIDGRPSSQEELQSLKASEVLNVEFSNNVPAIYGDGDFMINVRLKKPKGGGSVTIGEMNDFRSAYVYGGAALRYHQGSSSWLVGGSFNYCNNNKTYDKLYREYLSSMLPVTLSEIAHSPFNYKSSNATLQYVYAPSSDLMLAATYSFRNYNTLRKSFTEYVDSYSGREEEYGGTSRTHSTDPTHTLNVYLSKEINPSNTIDANMVATVLSKPYQSEITYDRPSAPVDYRNEVNAHRYSLLSGLTYSHTFSNRSRLGLSYLLTLSTNTNGYPPTDEKSRMKETHNQIYADYRMTLVDRVTIYLKSGLNIQRFKLDGDCRTFLNNLSQLNIQWVIDSRWSLNNNLTYGSYPLSLGQLDDHLVQTSPYLYNNGNENLKPLEKIQNRLTASFYTNSISLNGIISYTRHINPVMTVARYDDVLKGYLSQPVNGLYGNEVGLMLQEGLEHILDMFAAQATLEYRHYDFKDGAGWRSHTNSIGGEIYLTWQYRKWQIDYSRSFPLKSSTGYVVTRDPNYDELSVRFRPDSHWQLGLSWAYMFDKKGWHSTVWKSSQEERLVQTREMRHCANMIRFSCSYNMNFGNPFKKQVRQRVLDLKDTGNTFNDYGK